MVLAAALVCGAWQADAWACQIIVPGTYVLDPTEQQQDTQAPATPQVSNVKVLPGSVPSNCDGSSGLFSGCSGVGAITLAATSTDDRTSTSQLGYKLTLTRGTVPRGLTGIGETVGPLGNLPLTMGYIDSDPPLALDFDVEVRAVDLAGNASPAAALVTIRFAPGLDPTCGAASDTGAPPPSPRTSSGGCRLGPGPTSDGAIAVALLALLWLLKAGRARIVRHRGT